MVLEVDYEVRLRYNEPSGSYHDMANGKANGISSFSFLSLLFNDIAILNL